MNEDPLSGGSIPGESLEDLLSRGEILTYPNYDSGGTKGLQLTEKGKRYLQQLREGSVEDSSNVTARYLVLESLDEFPKIKEILTSEAIVTGRPVQEHWDTVRWLIRKRYIE